MYDDEDEYEDEYNSPEANAGVVYEEKGKSDRAFVDQQAKEYDEMKKRKNKELEVLKARRLSAQAKLATKERELHALKIDLRKEEFVDKRERVAKARQPLSEVSEMTREEKAVSEVEDIVNKNVEIERDTMHATLLREVSLLRIEVDEVARKISLMEHELMRL